MRNICICYNMDLQKLYVLTEECYPIHTYLYIMLGLPHWILKKFDIKTFGQKKRIQATHLNCDFVGNVPNIYTYIYI